MTEMTMMYVGAAIFAVLIVGYCVWVAMPPRARLGEIRRSFTRARMNGRNNGEAWFAPWCSALWNGQQKDDVERQA